MYGAVGMTWGEDNRWTSEVTLSPGTYDFKLVIVRDQDGTVAAWESGENRSVTVRVLCWRASALDRHFNAALEKEGIIY